MKRKTIAQTFIAIGILSTVIMAVAMNMAANNTTKDIVIPEGMRRIRIFEVGGIRFSTPIFYTANGSKDAEKWIEPFNPNNIYFFTSVDLRNIYYGQCLQRVDGRCGIPRDDDKEYANFMVNLRVPKPGEDIEHYIEKKNKEFANDCHTPEEASIKYKLTSDRGSAKWGVFCSFWFEYEGLVAKMRFRTGNFPRFEIPRMQAHVTHFLNQHRIHH